MNAQPLGADVRRYGGGDLFYWRGHATMDLAYAEAVAKQDLQNGWIDRVPMPR